MLIVLAVALFSGMGLAAQTLSLTSNVPTVYPGGSVTLTVQYTDASPSASVSGLEWAFGAPNGTTLGTPVLGAAGAAALKTVSCNLFCLVYGLNANVIGTGPVASVPVSIAVNQAPGPVSISLQQVVAGTAQGSAVNVTVAVPVSVLVLNRADLNGDGKVDMADVQIAVNQATGAAVCGTGDINGDGKCNVMDVLLVIKAALGI